MIQKEEHDTKIQDQIETDWSLWIIMGGCYTTWVIGDIITHGPMGGKPINQLEFHEMGQEYFSWLISRPTYG